MSSILTSIDQLFSDSFYIWYKPIQPKQKQTTCCQYRVEYTGYKASRIISIDVIKWKHFPRYRPFVRGIHRSPVDSLNKGQWHGASMFSLFCAWTNDSANNRAAGDLRLHRAHYDVTATWHILLADIHSTRIARIANSFPMKLYGMQFRIDIHPPLVAVWHNYRWCQNMDVWSHHK